MKEQSLSTKHTDGTVSIIFDLETNGLSFTRQDARIHCIALHWVEDNNTEAYNDEKYVERPGTFLKTDTPMAAGYSIATALHNIEVADVLIGHNIIGFDLPFIHSVYPWFNPTGIVIDTLLLSRLYHPNLLEIDKKHQWKDMPKPLYGKHSLEAYGYRLGLYKGDFAKDTDWKKWSQEMQDYCIQDVKVTERLCNHFHPYLTGSR